MIKNPTHEERVKSYFVQAAMEILRGEGIQNLSVRHVADRAGYSYATLYNYFKDINELLSVCITEFLNENKENIAEAIKFIPKGKDRLAMINYTYIKYFVQYPGIFDLIYKNKLNSKNTRTMILTFLEDLCAEDWNYLIANGNHSKEIVAFKKESIKYTITGMLLLYNNLQFPDDFNKFQQAVKDHISELLEL